MQKYKEIRGKGPEIRILMNSNNFLETMTEKQLSAWLNFVDVATNVLGKNIAADWKERIDRLMLGLQTIGCPTVSSKMHLLFKHKDKCEPYLGIFSDKHGERLNKEMEVIEKRFKEMLAECTWSLKRDTTFYNSTRNLYWIITYNNFSYVCIINIVTLINVLAYISFFLCDNEYFRV